MLAEVIRRHQEIRTEPTMTILEEALKIVKSEVKLGRTVPTRELDADVFQLLVRDGKHT